MTEQITSLTGRRLTIVLACQLMIGIDATIVNVALPDIQSSLHFSQTGVAWVFNAYTLAFGGLLLLGGRAGDLLGRRRVFASGVALFTVASLMSGLAQDPSWLVAARALQGVGGAVASPNVLALIMASYADGARRTRALSVFATVSSASFALGLIAGGLLTAVASWRWVFFVNVPIGAAILVLTPVFLHESQPQRGRFDLAGALTATAGVAGLTYAVTRTSGSGWSDPVTVTLLALAALLLTAFVVTEARASQPVMPLRLFADPRRAAAYATALLVPCTIFAVIYFLLQYLQDGFGYSALKSGVAFLPMAVVLMGVLRVVRKLISRWGTKPVMLTGITLITGSLVWLAELSRTSSYLAGVLGPLVLLGAGGGLTTVALSVTSLSGVRREDSGAGAGVFQTLQWTSWSLGLAVLITVYHAQATGTGRAALANGTAGAFTGATVIALLGLLCTLLFVPSGVQKEAPAPPVASPQGDDVAAGKIRAANTQD
jgi:EmrB/QacA subfamily drug resistance transporter